MENRSAQRVNNHATPRISVTLNIAATTDKKANEEALKPAVFAKSLLDSSFAYIDTKPGY